MYVCMYVCMYKYVLRGLRSATFLVSSANHCVFLLSRSLSSSFWLVVILRSCLLVGSVVCDCGFQLVFLSTCLFAMTAPRDRPLSVSLTCQGDVSARDVIYSLQSTVKNGKIKCVTQTRVQSWQITFPTRPQEITSLQ